MEPRGGSGVRCAHAGLAEVGPRGAGSVSMPERPGLSDAGQGPGPPCSQLPWLGSDGDPKCYLLTLHLSPRVVPLHVAAALMLSCLSLLPCT